MVNGVMRIVSVVCVVGIVGLSCVSGIMGLVSEVCLVNFVCAVLYNVLSTTKYVCEHYCQYSNFLQSTFPFVVVYRHIFS